MDDGADGLAAEAERLREENRLLCAKIDLLVRKIFGPSSEGLDPAQLELLLEADGEADAKKPVAPAEDQEPAAGADERRADPGAPPVTAKLPGRPIEGGIAAPGLIAGVVVAKYCDHLPPYRQEQIFASRHGVEIPRQSLARWVEAAATWLQPVYRQIRDGVFEGGYLQADETPGEVSRTRARQGPAGLSLDLQCPWR